MPGEMEVCPVRKTIALTSLWGLVSVAPAFAESTDGGHFYAGVGVGYSSADDRAQTDIAIPDIGGTVDSIQINGLPFDDDDVAWSAFVGYAATPYIGVEAGFWDHGTFSFKTPSQLVGGFAVDLAIQEWYVGSTFRYPLPFLNRLALTGSVGVSRAQFDADGSARVLVIPPGPPFFPVNPPTTRTLPFATPDDETGGYWRAGLSFRITDSIESGLNYGRRYLDVLQVETAALTVSYAF
jgi:hypothetical protein